MSNIYLLLYVSVLSACLTSLSACVTKGRHFPSDLSWITKEVTKQDDVLLLLGRPFMVGSAGGIMTWSYGRYNYHLIGRDYIKELKIYWNSDNTVRDYSFQSSFPSDMRKAGVIERRSNKQKNKIQRQPSQKHAPLIDKVRESVIDKDLDLETMLDGSPIPDVPEAGAETNDRTSNEADEENDQTSDTTADKAADIQEHTDSANHSE